MKCPKDDTLLVMTDRSGVEIDYCPTCRGVWLDRGELDKIIDRAAAAPAVALSEPARGGATPQPQAQTQPPAGQAPGFAPQFQDRRDERPRDAGYDSRYADDRYREDYRRDDHNRRDDHYRRNSHGRPYKRRESFLRDLFDF